MITSYPKIFSIGTDYIRDIFTEPVEVSEKIDGSMFALGKINGQVYMRSKGAMLYAEHPQKMFVEAMSYIDSIQDRLPEGVTFYAEYLRVPKHNTLKYDRVPKHHLALFGVKDASERFYDTDALSRFADMLGIEPVPILFMGSMTSASALMDFLDRDSILGGTKIEGVVVKNYSRRFVVGGQPMPLMAGKCVSERFKEVHRERWSTEEKGKSKLDTFFGSFRTPARWEKAVQHLAERGELEHQPRDIGKLFKEVHQDIEAEEQDTIKTFLWNHFKDQLKRTATANLPNWYKERLAERAFGDGDNA